MPDSRQPVLPPSTAGPRPDRQHARLAWAAGLSLGLHAALLALVWQAAPRPRARRAVVLPVTVPAVTVPAVALPVAAERAASAPTFAVPGKTPQDLAPAPVQSTPPAKEHSPRTAREAPERPAQEPRPPPAPAGDSPAASAAAAPAPAPPAPAPPAPAPPATAVAGTVASGGGSAVGPAPSAVAVAADGQPAGTAGRPGLSGAASPAGQASVDPVAAAACPNGKSWLQLLPRHVAACLDRWHGDTLGCGSPTLVRLTVRGDGQWLEKPRLLRSCGDVAADREVVSAMATCAPLPPPGPACPAVLVDVPVRFAVEDEP